MTGGMTAHGPGFQANSARINAAFKLTRTGDS